MGKAQILRKAEFNSKLRTYLVLYGLFVLLSSVIGILAIPFWILGIGSWYSRRYFNHIECELTSRALRFKKGILFQVEKTIPLDKIQDLTFKEGPLLRKLGLSILQIETAGQSGNNTADMQLIGIVDAADFRQAVIEQRDEITESKSTTRANDTTSTTDNNILDLLDKIHKQLQSIDEHLKAREGV